MRAIMPPGLSAQALDRALAAFAGVVGSDWVLADDSDRDTYADAYALGDGGDHVAAAAVAPKSTEEVQAILRLANEHKVPLWVISRGKNLGYGYSAPLMSGSVVMDLSRMNRILDVDEKRAYCVLEPGVGFFDLFNYLEENKIRLWMSIPGNAWGSVIGNALERGLGYTSHNDNSTNLCGLEVALPSGELVRTGLGAMTGSKGWRHYPFGFGPSWDQMFVQSNLGVVTQAGLWLMPEPEATLKVRVNLKKSEDIAWAIDALTTLRLHEVIQHPMVFGNYLHDVAVRSTRDEWYKGPGALPDDIGQKMIDQYGVGWWGFSLNLFGDPDAIAANAKVVNAALEPGLGHSLEWTPWRRGEPYAASPRPEPSLLALQIVNWRGGRGGHIGFSPVMPPDGQLALKQFLSMKQRFAEFGLDYYTSFTVGFRHINNINMIIYDRDDPVMVGQAKGLFDALIADNKALGYGEYRTHLNYMDAVSDTYDFNNFALRRLNETVKNALDPNGILAPGKNGVWPTAYPRSHA